MEGLSAQPGISHRLRFIRSLCQPFHWRSAPQ